MNDQTGRLASQTQSAAEHVPDRSPRPQAPPLARHIGNLEAAARRRLPRPMFDYLDGGSYDEVTLRANRSDLDALRLRQRGLSEGAARNLRTTILGLPARLPVALAPIGSAGLLHPLGEIHAAQAAKAFGVPFCLSTLSICSIEEVSAATGVPFLFQLYMFKDRGVNAALMRRAEQAGCPALVLTLDTAVQGRRNRDCDHGLVVPLKFRPPLVMRMLGRPRWLLGWLRSKRTLGNLAPFMSGNTRFSECLAWAERNHKGAISAADLAWVRETWPHKLVVKGVLDPEDAKLAAELGADAIVVSNHGGRQLDGAESSARAFPAIRDTVGDKVELLFDSGIRSGLDVLKALGLGARGCLLGRAAAYGLAAYGGKGVTAALEIIEKEIYAGMMLTGVEDITELPSDFVLGQT